MVEGLRSVPLPSLSCRCVQPAAPGICEEGSLRLAVPLDGGAAYAICVCTSPPPAHAAFAPAGDQKHQARVQRRRALLHASRTPSGGGGGGGAGGAGAVRDGAVCAWTAPSASEIEAGGGKVPADKGVVMCVNGYQVRLFHVYTRSVLCAPKLRRRGGGWCMTGRRSGRERADSSD